jgi:hypothetical protein
MEAVRRRGLLWTFFQIGMLRLGLPVASAIAAPIAFSPSGTWQRASIAAVFALVTIAALATLVLWFSDWLEEGHPRTEQGE